MYMDTPAQTKKFSIARKDEELLSLVHGTDQRTLASWAIDCAHRVLHFFEDTSPNDGRPRKAIDTLKQWLESGVFAMRIIRKASLDAHAAARDSAEDGPARSAARATGQAVATAHVPRHAYGSAIYAQQAIFRSTKSFEAVEQERNWQFLHLLSLKKNSETHEILHGAR